MNSNTHSSRTATSARRALPVLAIVGLAVGLAACQTPPQGMAQPLVEVISAPNPVGVDTTTGRLVGQVESSTQADTVAPSTVVGVGGLKLVRDDVRQPSFGSWTDRISAQIEYTKTHGTVVYMSPDQIELQLRTQHKAMGTGQVRFW